MSKPSRRPNREAAKQRRKELKQKQEQLRAKQKALGLVPPPHTIISNKKCEYENEEAEQKARTDATTEQARIIRSLLPTLLNRMSKIDDPRNAKKSKYKLTVLLLYGMLFFVYQMTSRREANREMTRPTFMANLRMLFPDLETIPHNDTLFRLLERIDVNEIEAALLDIIRHYIRNKKFRRYLINNCYPIAVDGTQKFARNTPWCEESLQRRVGKPEDDKRQYYVYVLEANLAFYNGMTIPLLSEFLDYTQGDTESTKQDCELKAFKRLSERLKSVFSHLPIMLLIDGLYSSGPIIELCRKKNWDFMIVLQDGSLKSVWEEYESLRTLDSGNTLDRIWHDRMQHFEWVNNIIYEYGPNLRKKLKLNVVVCEETWKEVDEKSGEVVTRSSRHAWISRRHLSAKNVHERCNLGARHRWNIETSNMVEKHHGYQYEHCFSYAWNAMKGCHYLMRLGHLINELTKFSACLYTFVCDLGVRGLIKFIFETIVGPWLNSQQVRERLDAPFQLRLRM